MVEEKDKVRVPVMSCGMVKGRLRFTVACCPPVNVRGRNENEGAGTCWIEKVATEELLAGSISVA